ncbi:GAD-like domain-containing protein [Roseateles asaccharophilus]|uniref:GAD-related domain-containing protein n=1 Tax=Roseateles asaccharophilus TaxID=582607 RepID=A0ABU2A7J2_9BURK|nr:GAD-like domain-containing protein [Roseateles asaccharophilus]MDR7333100.1 hypothetical protein [Roseateles asaccharophilus]
MGIFQRLYDRFGKPSAPAAELQPFLQRHPPSAGLTPATADQLARYADHLPAPLLALWQQHGFGFYGQRLVQLIDPDVYRDNLWGWLMRDEPDMDRLPIALSAMGTIFYYRKLSEDGDEDVSFLNPHTSESGCTVWSLAQFFNEWLGEADNLADYLHAKELDAMAARAGPLARDQMYFHEPALRLGGDGSLAHIARGSAPVHLDLLLQLATS